MHTDPRHPASLRHAVAALWLAAGSLLLLLTPLPAHTRALGWSPLIWLVLAPLGLLLALEPRLPLRLLAVLRRHLPALSTRRVQAVRRRPVPSR